MESKKRDFDKAAGTWDELPRRVQLASDVARAISEEIELTSEMDVLDFGCGTGLLTFLLQPYVHSIKGADSSRGMLDIFTTKIKDHGLRNIEAVYLDPERGDIVEGRYHLVVSNMTFHHIGDIRPLLLRIHEIILPGGHVCITDLDSDGGHFHRDDTGVFHKGFDRAEFRGALAAAGFEEIRDRTAATITKPMADGSSRDFTIFLMIGRKPLPADEQTL